MTIRYAIAFIPAQVCIRLATWLAQAAGHLDSWGKLGMWLPYLGED